MVQIAARCFFMVKVAGLLRRKGRSQVVNNYYLVVNVAHAFDGAGYLLGATLQARSVDRAGECRSALADCCFDVSGREFRVVQDFFADFCLHCTVINGGWRGDG